jgi:hypothetical protein
MRKEVIDFKGVTWFIYCFFRTLPLLVRTLCNRVLISAPGCRYPKPIGPLQAPGMKGKTEIEKRGAFFLFLRIKPSWFDGT